MPCPSTCQYKNNFKNVTKNSQNIIFMQDYNVNYSRNESKLDYNDNLKLFKE